MSKKVKTIDLMNVVVRNIDNEPVTKEELKTFVKIVGDAVFKNAKSNDDLELGRDINKLEPFECTREEKDKIKTLISDPQKGGFIFYYIYQPICDYLDEQFKAV